MTDNDTKTGPARHAPGPERAEVKAEAAPAPLVTPGPLVVGTYRYGKLVGGPELAGTLSDAAYSRNKLAVIVRDVATLAAAPANDVIVACTVGWETVLDPFQCHMQQTALGAGVTLSFGDVNHPTALDNAVSAAAVGEEQLLSAVTAANYFQPLWQQLGYASLVAAQATGKQATLLFSIGGAAATGSLAWGLYGYRKS